MLVDTNLCPLHTSEEIWRDVVGYEGKYKVSNRGRVKSLKRTVVYKDGRIWKMEEKIMSLKLKAGFRVVATLRTDGKSRTYYVHRLVLQAFRGPCPLEMECRHFPDSNPHHNCLENIQWGTKQEQHQDKIIHGTTLRGRSRPDVQGTNNKHAKLTEDKVKDIRRLYLKKEWTLKKLGRKFKVHFSVIHDVVKRNTWKHVL